MIKVYCERGAMKFELNELKKKGYVQLIHFPYEGHNKRVEVTMVLSLVTMDMTHMTSDSTIRLSDCDPSEKYEEIKSIIGDHEFDERHIDTAYKNRYVYFLSRDKDDIISHAEKLENLLGVKFLTSGR